jgi:hypothetical protein
MSRRLSKKAPHEGGSSQGSLPNGQGRALWCEDEHRLGLKPVIRKVWSPIGQRPLVEVHQRYEWTYLYAFAHPKSGEVHRLILPTVKAEVFSMALEHLTLKKWERERENASSSWSIGPDGTRQRRS